MLENETSGFIWIPEVMTWFIIFIAAPLPWAHEVKVLCLTVRGSKYVNLCPGHWQTNTKMLMMGPRAGACFHISGSRWVLPGFLSPRVRGANLTDCPRGYE